MSRIKGAELGGGGGREEIPPASPCMKLRHKNAHHEAGDYKHIAYYPVE